MADLRVAAACRTSRKSRGTRASPSVTALRERGRRARAVRQAYAPLAAGQAAPHPGLTTHWNNVGALAACLCFREVQGSARRPIVSRPQRATGPLRLTASFVLTPPWTMPSLGAIKM